MDVPTMERLQYKKKNEYLNKIISYHKAFDYSKEVRDRISSKWSLSSFELNIINDNIVLPYKNWLFLISKKSTNGLNKGIGS